MKLKTKLKQFIINQVVHSWLDLFFPVLKSKLAFTAATLIACFCVTFSYPFVLALGINIFLLIALFVILSYIKFEEGTK